MLNKKKEYSNKYKNNKKLKKYKKFKKWKKNKKCKKNKNYKKNKQYKNNQKSFKKMATHPYDKSQMGQWIHNLPKAELHLHLEGAIPLGALWELIQQYGGDPSIPTKEALRGRLTYDTFPDFIETWIWKNGFLRTYDDFQFIAKAIA